MWQRWNQSSHIFEKSDDNGGTWTPLPLSGASITEGTVSQARLPTNIAYTNAANTFSQPQTISHGNAQLTLFDLAAPVDARLFRVLNVGQVLYLQSMNDAQTTGGGYVSVNRLGDFLASRDIYEKSRALPIGHWTLGSAVSYSHWGMTGNYDYAVIGKTLFISLNARINPCPGGQTVSRFNMPGGFVVGSNITTPITVYSVPSGVVWETGLLSCGYGLAYFDCSREHTAVYPVGDTIICFSIAIPIL